MVITNSRGCTMNTTEMAEAKNFLIWLALWAAALIVLLPALAGN
jgi:hypothetical protein